MIQVRFPKVKHPIAYYTSAIVSGLVLGLVLLMLTACGSGTSQGVNAATPTSQAPAASVIADDMKCENITAQEPSLYAVDEVTATCNGQDVTIVTFQTNAARDMWVKVAQTFGPVDTIGDRYAVSPV